MTAAEHDRILNIIAQTAGRRPRRRDQKRDPRTPYELAQAALTELHVHGYEITRRTDTRPNIRCTGLTAFWCPEHGNCTCPAPENSLDAPGCPLHAWHSTHAHMLYPGMQTTTTPSTGV